MSQLVVVDQPAVDSVPPQIDTNAVIEQKLADFHYEIQPEDRWDGIELPEDLREIAEKEFGETKETRENALQELRTKLSSSAEYKENSEKIDKFADRDLLMYLRSRKFRIEQAYEVIMNNVKLQQEHPEWFENLSGEEFRDLYSNGFMRILLARDRNNRRISTLYPANMTKMGKMDANHTMRWNIWAMTRMGRDPYMQVNGTVIIENFEEFSFAGSMKMQKDIPPQMMKVMFHYTQHCVAYRLGGIYVMNQPGYISFLLALVKPFMSAKMKSRLHVCGDRFDELYEMIDQKNLPKEFKGTSDEHPLAWLEQQITLEKAGY